MAYIFSFVFPFLLVMAAMQAILQKMRRRLEGVRMTMIPAIVALLIVLIPIGGIPAGRWLISLNANFSIPLLALLLNSVWQNSSGKTLLDEPALTGSKIFAVAGGLVLYPMALGVGLFDPYAWGWRFSWFFVVMLLITAGFLIKKNRFGLVLLFCILAFNLNLLESTNFWDYLLDPFLVIISCFGLLRRKK